MNNFKSCLKLNKNKQAFTFVEIAIVIMVVSIILVSFLVSSKSNFRSKKKIETSQKIEKIYNSLKAFVANNHRLPCPAPINELYNSATYGEEGINSGSCLSTFGAFYSSGNFIYGLLPVKALSLKIEDSFDEYNSKFAYIIDKRFAENSSNFNTISEGGLVIKKYITNAEIYPSENAVFAIISYGENKLGAFNKSSITQIPASLDLDEIENSTSNFDENLFSYSNRNNDSFDDIVFYKNKKDLLLDANIYFLMDKNTTESNN